MDDRTNARAEDIADQERAIQRDIDAKDKTAGDDKPSGAMQAGARPYPEPPFPKQHQTKPGDEAALDPAPLYDAPFWKGSGKLDGFAALITGADSGIGKWQPPWRRASQRKMKKSSASRGMIQTRWRRGDLRARVRMPIRRPRSLFPWPPADHRPA